MSPVDKPLLPLENEHSAGSQSEAAINNKPADKDTVTGFDITPGRTTLHAAGGEDGSDRYRGKKENEELGAAVRCDGKRSRIPPNDPCRSTLTNFCSRI